MVTLEDVHKNDHVQSSGEDETPSKRSSSKEVGKKALAQIKLLISSQISLERRSSKMVNEADKEKAQKRMEEVDGTLRQLISVAVRKRYISSDCTIQTLREEVNKERQERAEASSVTKMSKMKERLEEQASRISTFLAERTKKGEEWEREEWNVLLKENAVTVALMKALSERGLVTEDMITMATLPAEPPSKRNGKSPEAKNNTATTSQAFDSMASQVASPSPQPGSNVQGSPNMMPGMMQGMQPGMMPGMQAGMMPMQQGGHSMMPGMMPSMMPGMQGMMPHMQQGSPGMVPGMMPSMMPGMMPMMNMPMSPQPMGMAWPATPPPQAMSTMPDTEDSAEDRPAKGSKATRRSNNTTISSSGEGGEESVRGGKNESSAKSKSKKGVSPKALSSGLNDQDEKLWTKNKGVGVFNNRMHVAEDIRTLGMVPEEEDEMEVPADAKQAARMEVEQLEGVEEELRRQREGILLTLMKGHTARKLGMDGALGGAAAAPGAQGGSMMATGDPSMQQQQQQHMLAMQQQQQMFQMQQMMMQMNMHGGGAGGMQGMPGMAPMSPASPMMSGAGMVPAGGFPSAYGASPGNM